MRREDPCDPENPHHSRERRQQIDCGLTDKILLVDEWRAVRLLGRRVLDSLQFRTREARDGRDALETLALEPEVSAVLLEWTAGRRLP